MMTTINMVKKKPKTAPVFDPLAKKKESWRTDKQGLQDFLAEEGADDQPTESWLWSEGSGTQDDSDTGFDPLLFEEPSDYSGEVETDLSGKVPASFADRTPTGPSLEVVDPSIEREKRRQQFEKKIKYRASIPAYTIRNAAYFAGGVAEGLASPFESIAKSLASRSEIKKMLEALDNSEKRIDRLQEVQKLRDDGAITNQEFATRKRNILQTARRQREAAIRRIEELEKFHLEDDHFYRSYRTMEKQVAKRLKKNTRAVNAVDDLTTLSKIMPMLFTQMFQAAINENPNAAREMGLLLTRDGVASTLSLLNPKKLDKNLEAMPFSTILAMVPIARIISKSPAALASLADKFEPGNVNRLLGNIGEIDRSVRISATSAAEAVGGTPLLPESVLATAAGGALGSMPARVVRVGEMSSRAKKLKQRYQANVDAKELEAVLRYSDDLPAGHPDKMGQTLRRRYEQAMWEAFEGQRGGFPGQVSPLRPGDTAKTLGSFLSRVVGGAKVGWLAGVPVEAGLVTAMGHLLMPNVPLTRSMQRAIAQLIRHTSAQTGAAPELAVRGMMVAPAESVAQVRSAVDQIEKIFRAEKDAASSPSRVSAFFGEEVAPTRTAVELFEYSPQGRTVLPSQVSAKDMLTKIDELENLLNQDDFLQTLSRDQKIQAINQLNKMRAATRQNASGNITFSASLEDVLKNLDKYIDEAGLSESVKQNVRGRIADASLRTSVLLQDGEMARAVAKRLIARGIDSTSALEFIKDLADNPFYNGVRRDARIKDGSGKLISLDDEVRAAMNQLDDASKARIIGGVASHEAARYQKLIASAAHARAMRNEASKGGILESILNRNNAKGAPRRSIFSATPEEYAEVLARSLAAKDMRSGGMTVPLVIPQSAAGKGMTDLRRLQNAIRVMPDETIVKILTEELGSVPTPAELRNFRNSMELVSRDLQSVTPGTILGDGYVLKSADDLAHENRQRLIDEGVTDPDLLQMAKDADMPSVFITKGLDDTYGWHRRSSGNKYMEAARALTRMFKGNQTVRSPIGHMHNITGNLGLMLIRYGEDPISFARNATREGVFYQKFKHGTLPELSTLQRGTDAYRSNRVVRLMDQSGVVGKDFVAAELLKMSRSGVLDPQASQAMRQFLQNLENLPGGMETLKALKKFDKGMSKAYGWEDNLPKLRFGMESGRRLLKAFDDLSPNTPIRFPTSPVSTTTLIKRSDGKLYRGNKALTDAQVDRLVAAYIKRNVDEMFLNYSETSGLNKVISNMPGLAAVAPYFTFNHKAMGFGGTKGFLRNVLEATDGIETLDPKILMTQVKEAASLAARRAMLVNSFKQFSTQEEDYLARQLAFNKNFPSAVVFDMVSENPDLLQYKDLVGMSAFAPSEMRLRATAYLVGKIANTFGRYKKGNKLQAATGFSDKEAEQFVKELQHGDIGSVALIGSIMGLGRGPMATLIAEVQSPNPTFKKVLNTGLPVVLPPPAAIPIRELIAHVKPDWEVYSGKRIDRNDPALNERWSEYMLRRLMKKGHRKIRIYNTDKEGNINRGTLESQMKRRITQNYSQIKQNLLTQRSNAEGKMMRLFTKKDKLTDTENAEIDRQLKELEDTIAKIGAYETKMYKGRPRVTKQEGLLGKIEQIKEEEMNKLLDALVFVDKVRRLRRERFSGPPRDFPGKQGVDLLRKVFKGGEE